MRFYTNVQMIGNNFLVRGYEDGRKVMFQEKYNPTLFVKSRKETKWKTLEGEHVEPIKPGLVRDCREFIKKYDGVEGFKVFGNERYQYQYISDKYPEEEIKFDINKVGLVTMDIEVQSEEGFPSPDSCSEGDVVHLDSGLCDQRDYHLGSSSLYSHTEECDLSLSQ